MEEVTLANMMLGEPAVMEATEPMRYARRRMQTEALHSIIIVQANRPVGIVETRHLRGITPEDLNRPVSDFMAHEVPTLSSETSPDQAIAQLGHDVEVDQFPVVRSDGTLAGVVTRETLLRYRDHGSEATHVEHAAMTGPVTADVAAARIGDTTHQLRDGMKVEDIDGSKLGTISEIHVSRSGEVQSFTVEHGLLFKNHKRLTGDLLQSVEGDTVRVVLQSTDFKMIPDLDDQGDR